ADGSVRFEHVRPDRYRLLLDCPGLARTALALDVPEGGLDLGVVRPNVPTAMGRIEGRVWRPVDEGGGPWASAEGYVGGLRFQGLGDTNPSIEFRADEQGDFRVEGVPTGLTTVGFPYRVYDMVHSHKWSALVVEGQATQVRAFDPEERRQLTLAFEVGDGSREQYESGTGLGAARKVENVTMTLREF